MANFNPTQNNYSSFDSVGNDNFGEITLQTDIDWSENTTLGFLEFETSKSDFLIIQLIPLTLDSLRARCIAQAKPDGSGFEIVSLKRNIEHSATYLFQYIVNEVMF